MTKEGARGPLGRNRSVRGGGILTFDDRAPDKKAPNGARATLRGIRCYWLSDNSKPMTIRQFTPHIKTYLLEIFAKYGGPEKIPADMEQQIERLESGAVATQIAHIQAYANFLGIQSSLLALFAQMVSEEHAKEDGYRNTILSKIRAFKAALNVMEAAMMASDSDVFSKTLRKEKARAAGVQLYANIDTLRAVANAYTFEIEKSGADNNNQK
jgi:hypothetical protein